jgi:hypothetical protein
MGGGVPQPLRVDDELAPAGSAMRVSSLGSVRFSRRTK